MFFTHPQNMPMNARLLETSSASTMPSPMARRFSYSLTDFGVASTAFSCGKHTNSSALLFALVYHNRFNKEKQSFMEES